MGFMDADKNYFDGGKTYKVTLPANIPAAKFWSFTVYDNQTRSTLRTRTAPRPSISAHPSPSRPRGAPGFRPHLARGGSRFCASTARWSRSSRRHGVRPRSSSSNERPGADKDKPIVGLIVIRDLGPSGDRWKDGSILDPDDGKVYKTELWVEEGKRKVRGYVGLFYRTQTWLK
jgi:Uncharacterized protein conserved in bacteria (DUF2147)/Protein of unknown function (DUF1214)